jgi:hypothetical protein
MISADWIKCAGGAWCALEGVDLTQVRGRGVYVIWHDGDPPRTVHVGYGNISAGLGFSRLNQEILNYAENGTLRATWATVPEDQAQGALRFLMDQLSPLVADAPPAVEPLPMNAPWAA